MEDPSQSNQGQLCRNSGCGYYGSSKNDGMCSLCYKDTLQKKRNSGRKSPNLPHLNPKGNDSSSVNGNSNEREVTPPASDASTCPVTTTTSSSLGKNSICASMPASSPVAIPSASSPSIALTSPCAQSYSNDEMSTSLDSTSSSPSKMKKNRCASCRKRLGLTGFFCRCGNLYCSMHRYSDQHECRFDYRADAQAKIRKENPVVMGEKINKI